MRWQKHAATTVAALVLSACAVPNAPLLTGPPSYAVGTTFDSSQARALLLPGVNSIKGNAFLRQKGGGVVTCAGSPVFLVPATYYAKKRFDALFIMNGDTGLNPGRVYKFDPDPAEYYQLMARSTCDSQGSFTFDRVADGEFYITTQVEWVVAGRQQGGKVAQRVKVSGGQILNAVIAPL